MEPTTLLAIGALALALLALLFVAILADDNREREDRERMARLARRPLEIRPTAASTAPQSKELVRAGFGVDPYAHHRPGCGCVHHR